MKWGQVLLDHTQVSTPRVLLIFNMYSIRPSSQSAVFLEVSTPKEKIYSEPWLHSDKRGTKSNSPCIVSFLLSSSPSGVTLKIIIRANIDP